MDGYALGSTREIVLGVTEAAAGLGVNGVNPEGSEGAGEGEGTAPPRPGGGRDVETSCS